LEYREDDNSKRIVDKLRMKNMLNPQSRPGSLRERTPQLRSLWWVGPHLSPLPHPIRRRGEKQQESTNLSLGLCQDFCEGLS